jgi:hypothetical protein
MALTANIALAGTGLCGAAPVLVVAGRRVTSDVTVSPADWGKQPCNTTPGAKGVIVSNYTTANLTWTASLGPTSGFTIVNSPNLVGPGNATTPSAATITVAPKPLGANVGALNDQLVVNLGSAITGVSGPRNVPLKVDVRGPVIALMPASITNFASDGNTVDTKSFTVSNTGNEDMYFRWALAATSQSWSYNAPNFVNAGGKQDGNVSFKAGGPGTYNATLTPSRFTSFLFSGPAACNAMTPLQLTGKR